MNFDFLKKLDNLNKAFDSCFNAEELALSKPDLSMISSRKSAEVLAKFVFLISHSDEVTNLSFSEILADPIVKKYLINPKILTSFHFIRKKGNKAVHTLESESAETAIEVLKNLHFVAGEIAKRMGLVSNYPKFDPAIVKNEKSEFYDINVDELAKEMYDDYVISKNRVNNLMNEFSEMCKPFYLAPGVVDLNECIEFKRKPQWKNSITYIQEHFAFLALQSLKSQYGQLENADIKYTAELTIYAKNEYKTTNLYEFVNALMHDLPKADGFKITSIYNGPSIAPWFNNEIREDFYNTIEKIGEFEDFTYSSFKFLYSHGEGRCFKYENGNWIDPKTQFTSDIIDLDLGSNWWSFNLALYIYFDCEKHPEILKSLHQAVRKHIPNDQLEECENTWKDGDVEIILDSIEWCPRLLRTIQNFLDEINTILKPIKEKCDVDATSCTWYHPTSPFAIAKVEWENEELKIIGTHL